MTATRDAGLAVPAPDADRVELILSQIEQLPTLPAVATRVLEVTASPDSSAADIVALIEADQSLTAKILSLVRRADLGVRQQVTTVSQAVVLLGFAAVRNAVLSIQIYETFRGIEPAPEAAMDRNEFWKHSLAVACAAQLLAQRAPGGPPADEAFVCGLLHDLGKIALDARLPKSYARIVRETNARRACICDVETAVLGLDHTVAGKRLARHWKLPETLVECIWLHHHPAETLPASLHSPRLVEIVHLADHLVRRQRIGYSGYNRAVDLPALADRLGLDESALDAVVMELGPLVEQNCRLVGFAALTTSELYTRALAEANEELGRVNEELTLTNRRLEMRSRCFEALRRFHAALSAEDRVPHVCRAAALSAQEVFQTDRTVVCFATTDALGVCHLGTTLPQQDGPAAVTLDVASGPPETPPSDRPVPLPPWAAPLAERFGEALGDRPIRMLPIHHLERLVGGVLVALAPDEIVRLATFADELRALAGAFGLAIATATARAQAETLMDELAGVNRRLHAAQEEILRSRSLTMIAEMAAGAAHELNNPLAVISGRAQMLASDAEEERQQATLRTVVEQAQRASRIVSELIAFAKPDPPNTETISLGPWMERLRQHWLAGSALEPEQLRVVLADPGLTVRADPDQLSEVLSALIANAMEATRPENARLVINSDSQASDETVVVSVEDNGRGMSSRILEHALDPFFSHRPAGRGRGLGLSKAYSLVLANGGRLWLESTPEVGTSVFVELPAGRTH